MKIGIDVHGVLDHDKHGRLFTQMSRDWVKAGHEVHIITGHRWDKQLLLELKARGVYHTHHFSITDYHLEIGTNMWFDENKKPYMNSYRWDRTKADYCDREDIDMHFDDSLVYGQYFKGKTLYIKVG